MKKQYQTPRMSVINLNMQETLLEAVSSVRNVSGNAEMGYGGSSENNTDGIVRSRESAWDESGEDW